MNNLNDLNNVLATTDAESLKFDNVGDTHSGTITEVEVRQVRNFDTDQPEFWDDGNPKQQIVVTLDMGGDQLGRIFIKLWGEWKRNLTRAIQGTGLDANSALAPGNHFKAWLSELRPNAKNPRLHPSKILQFEITPRANVGSVFGMDAQQAAPAPAAPAPQATQQATPAPAAPSPAAPAPQAAPQATSPLQQVTALIDQGLTDAEIAAQVGMDPAVVTALRGNAAADPNQPPF